jgi:hypothetical protein
MSLRQYQVGLHLLPLGNRSGLARLPGVEGVALQMGARWNVNPGENMGKNLQIREENVTFKSPIFNTFILFTSTFQGDK